MKLFDYKLLFSVQILHDYYKSGLSTDFILKPTYDTKRLIQKAGLICKFQNTGIEVYANTEKVNDKYKLITELIRENKLVFLMELKNPYFSNFTSLPFNPGQKTAYYFSNKVANPDNDKLYIMGETADYVDEKNLVSYVYDSFGVDIESTKPVAFGKLKFPHDEMNILQRRQNTEGKLMYSFGLENVPEGKFDFMLERKKHFENSFYNTGNFKSERFFGIVEIFLSKLPALTRFYDNDNFITPKNYHIRFKNRSTYWRYIIANNSEQEMDDPGIIQSNPPMIYDLEGNLSFVSKDTLPLSEQPVLGIELRTKKSSAASSIKTNLPNPSIDLVQVNRDDLDKVYSNIYVTI